MVELSDSEDEDQSKNNKDQKNKSDKNQEDYFMGEYRNSDLSKKLDEMDKTFMTKGRSIK